MAAPDTTTQNLYPWKSAFPTDLNFILSLYDQALIATGKEIYEPSQNCLTHGLFQRSS